jgi:hypothetical protein
MSILELKQAVTKLSKRDRQELNAYMVRLRHDTPEWKRSTAKKIRAMQAGKAVSAAELESKISRG